MAGENKSNVNLNPDGKGKKRKYLPHSRPAKKGWDQLRPGVQGVFITTDGGREHQAMREAINLLETFFEDPNCKKDSEVASMPAPEKPVNKILKFEDSDSSSNDNDDNGISHPEKPNHPSKREKEKAALEDEQESFTADVKTMLGDAPQDDIQPKKQKVDTERPIDELIDEELKELSNKKKRTFVSLDTGCNGVIFIKMCDPETLLHPSEIVHRIMSSAASTGKHMSRFLLRILPIEMTCYASEEEITKSIKPLFAQHFPKDSATSYKFAVLYEARSNTGIERIKIIDAVAKSVPQPHTVDLRNPDKTIIVQIVKTVCLVGVVERYKELAKYNLRQLTSQ